MSLPIGGAGNAEAFRERMRERAAKRQQIVDDVMADLKNGAYIHLYERIGTNTPNDDSFKTAKVITIFGDDVTVFVEIYTDELAHTANDPWEKLASQTLRIKRIIGDQVQATAFSLGNPLFTDFTIALEDAYGGSIIY